MATWTVDEPSKLELDQAPVHRVLVKLVEGRSASSAATARRPSRCRSWRGSRCGSARTGR